MTQTFTFPISGAFADCCIGNVEFLLNNEKKPVFFKFKTIDLSSDYRHLIVEIEDDKTSKEDVYQYIEKTLAGTNYKLCNEHARKYWLRGFLGLGMGALVLLLSCLGCHILWLKIAVAIVSLPLTCVLGVESFREAKIELRSKALSMDSLFMISIGTNILMSCMAFFIPGLPMMFEAGLMIFGFRHLGTAIKMSVYEQPSTVHYERLVNQTQYKRQRDNKTEWVSLEQLLPGDKIELNENDLVPLDGWLLPCESNRTVWMDVSRKEGTFIPQAFSANAPVTSGMMTKDSTLMRIGFGHSLKFYAKKPIKDCPSGEIWIYPGRQGIHIDAYSDRDARPVTFFLDAHDLRDQDGCDFSEEILDQLLLKTSNEHHQHTQIHLSDLAYQQLSRAIVQHANEQGLTQTNSYIKTMIENLKKPVVMPKQSLLTAGFFVPTILVIALLSGIVVGFFHSPLMAVRCMMVILISACPCTLGFIIPLVMKFAKEKAQALNIVLSQSDALFRFEQVDVIALDFHGTATLGEPKIHILYPKNINESAQKEIDTILALIEHHSKQYIGKAIYKKINGNQLLRNKRMLPAEAIKHLQGGIFTRIKKKDYLVGNLNLLRQFGVMPSIRKTGMIYFLRKNKNKQTYEELATIEMQDSLRNDTKRTIELLHNRGYKIRGITGADESIAEEYAANCPFDAVYANCPPVDEKNKKGKDTLIKEWQQEGHRVLMVGDGMNDSAAFKVAYTTIMMDHDASDEGIRYQAKARILNNKLSGVIDVLDLAHQSVWTIKLNLFFSLVYNLSTILLTNILLLSCGIMMHPGFCAALMLIQTAFIILNAYYQLQQNPLPPVQLLKHTGMFGTFLNQCVSPFVESNLSGPIVAL